MTRHGLGAALQSDDAAFKSLHAWFIAELVPVCAELLAAAADAGEIQPSMDALTLTYGVGNLCAGADHSARYNARLLVDLLITGLRVPAVSGDTDAPGSIPSPVST